MIFSGKRKERNIRHGSGRRQLQQVSLCVPHGNLVRPSFLQDNPRIYFSEFLKRPGEKYICHGKYREFLPPGEPVSLHGL